MEFNNNIFYISNKKELQEKLVKENKDEFYEYSSDIFEKYTKKANGLFLYNIPTGAGKTTTIANYLEKNIDREIYIITDLKNNLKEFIDKTETVLDKRMILKSDIDLFLDNKKEIEEYLKKEYNKFKNNDKLSKINDILSMIKNIKPNEILNNKHLNEDISTYFIAYLKDQARVIFKKFKNNKEIDILQYENIDIFFNMFP